ncbi:hypothetical protein KQI49_10150 [Virgibacillus sp. MSJ-26]|uniref:hypothetical protein n=1 Tax=Virgibacillus sp. MSJ-26 TaxID=2841522 RepID=UPI001C10E6FF|nr:hypothetical protein [Virgibacillus sp. MSJ-26]MBU5467181.1 hypothetical protein [Virgibacillus sp. MSJ-26]
MISFVVAQLIFFLGMIALFIVLLRFFKSKFINRKRNQWLLTGYLVILITSFTISYMLPINDNNSARSVRLINEDTKIPNLHVVPQMTGSIEMAEDYLVNEWEFDFEGTELNIEMLGEDIISNIAIETANLNNTVEVGLYMTPHIIDNIDLTTGHIPTANVSLEDSKLTFQASAPVEVKISQVNKEFPIRQFKDSNYLSNPDWGTGTGVYEESTTYAEDNKYLEPVDNRIFSTELLYIKIPADVDVSPNEELNLFFVDGD